MAKFDKNRNKPNMSLSNLFRPKTIKPAELLELDSKKYRTVQSENLSMGSMDMIVKDGRCTVNNSKLSFSKLGQSTSHEFSIPYEIVQKRPKVFLTGSRYHQFLLPIYKGCVTSP